VYLLWPFVVSVRYDRRATRNSSAQVVQRIRSALDALLTDPHFSAAAARAADRIAVEDPDRAASEALERIAHDV
jgi:hypothetical protein